MKKLASKKLTLDLNGLEVESFELAPSEQDQRGTVKAYESEWNCLTYPADTMAQSCLIGSCGYSCDSCDFSCEGTCGETSCFGPSCVCWTEAPYC